MNHIIFGKEICRVYMEDSIEGVIQAIRDGVEYHLYTWTGDDPISYPLILLKDMGDYGFINELDYNKIVKFLKKQDPTIRNLKEMNADNKRKLFYKPIQINE